MRNVLEMIKEKSTAGHSGCFEVQVGHPLSSPRRLGSKELAVCQSVGGPGWIPQHSVKSASGLCFVLPQLCQDGENILTGEGCVCTAFYLTCLCRIRYPAFCLCTNVVGSYYPAM